MSARRQRRSQQDAEFKQMLVRMPVQLLGLIDAAAKANWRSKTSEVVMRLQASFEGESINEHGVIVSTRPALTSDQKTGGYTCA